MLFAFEKYFSYGLTKRCYIRQGQIIVDVGINMDGDKICGDVDYESVKDIVEAITPVPGGVGTVTTSVLLKQTVSSAASIRHKI